MDRRAPPRPEGGPEPEVLARTAGDEVERAAEAELPVVARLMIEIRSDGSRTIARGAVEDVATGHRVGIDARGSSPAQLAFALAKSLWQVPRLAARVRGLLGRGKPR